MFLKLFLFGLWVPFFVLILTLSPSYLFFSFILYNVFPSLLLRRRVSYIRRDYTLALPYFGLGLKIHTHTHTALEHRPFYGC